jgi:hypothetical protein
VSADHNKLIEKLSRPVRQAYYRLIVRRRMAQTRQQHPTSLPVVRLLLQDVAAGIRVLRTRDGVPLSDDQVLERARNIVTGLIGNYRINSLDPRAARDVRAVPQLDLLLDRQDKRASAGTGAGRSARAGRHG